MAHVIHKAAQKDPSPVADLIRRSFRDVAERFNLTPENCPTHPSNCTPQWVADAMANGIRFFVLEREGRAVGCVGMEPSGEDKCHVERLAVLPAYRRRGHGRALMQHLVDEAKAHGITRVEPAIIAEHHELRQWYEKQGFTMTGTRRLDHLPFDVAFMGRSIAAMNR